VHPGEGSVDKAQETKATILNLRGRRKGS